jgi:hypothetical protein
MIRVGLRFARRDAPRLRHFADMVRRGELRGDLATYASAASSAEAGEPLIVQCQNLAEAITMAGLYVTVTGITHPAIEELTGQRPAK